MARLHGALIKHGRQMTLMHKFEKHADKISTYVEYSFWITAVYMFVPNILVSTSLILAGSAFGMSYVANKEGHVPDRTEHIPNRTEHICNN